MIEIAHQAALIPVAVMLLWGRGLGRVYHLTAYGLMLSWIGDSFAYYVDGSWVGTYAWLPFQLAFVLYAVAPREGRLTWMSMLLAASIASWARAAPEPEWIVSITGSLLVCALARGRIAPTLWTYFGVGTLAYLWMIIEIGSERFMLAWYAYQGCRLAAFTIFTRTVIEEQRVRSGKRGTSGSRGVDAARGPAGQGA